MAAKNLKSALRQISRNKLFSFVSIFGLATSMTAAIMIFYYASFELSFDQLPNVYRIATTVIENGEERYSSAVSPVTLAEKLASSPQIQNSTRLIPVNGWFDFALEYHAGQDNRVFNERDNGFYFAGPSCFSILRLQMLEGSENSLQKPYAIVVSVSVAKKYFGNSNPIGKTLKLRGSMQTQDYTVTGIMKDPPLNSHLNITILGSINSLKGINENDAFTYVQLFPDANIGDLQARLSTGLSDVTLSKNSKSKFLLQPVSDVHLHSHLENEIKPGGSATAIYFLLLLAVAVLVIAWINHINLTASRSMLRLKEVAIRKIIGANQKQIISQFVMESFVINAIAIICSMALIILFSRSFFNWTQIIIPASLSDIILERRFLFCLAALAATAIMIGIFPAITMSNANPLKLFKWKTPISKGISFRKSMVGFQFTCAMVLLISIIAFDRQFDLMRSQELGVDIKSAVILKAPFNVDDGDYLRMLRGFKEDLVQKTIIESVTTSTAVPGKNIGWSEDIKSQSLRTSADCKINVIDPGFIDAYKLKIITGRNFSEPDFPGVHFGDKEEPVILNHKAIAQLGFQRDEDAIGEIVFWGKNACRVIGVVKDFYQQSPKQPIDAILFTANMGPSLTIQLASNDQQSHVNAIREIEKAWKKYFPDNAFEYFMLQDSYDAQYDADSRIKKLFEFFCVLALIISFLGLYATASHSVRIREKEIAVRKVLGAQLKQLIRLLLNQYAWIILLSIVIASPIAYIVMSKWLNNFAVRITPQLWFWALPAIFILLIATLTVGFQTLKVALKNPAHTLKED